MARQNPEAQAFSKYLENRKILIADPSAAARSGLFKVFQELGAKSHQITLVNTFAQAQEQIPALRPQIVIVEFQLGKRCGLDLLQNQRESRPAETKECLFVVVTGNTSQSAVARAAEEDIDAYVLKPFTVESVRKTLLRTALAKIRPSDYVVTIDEGKKFLSEGKIDEAEKRFQSATELDKQPALAYYYLGQVKFMKKIMEEAKGKYNQGLDLNKIHYKCMVGLYDLLMGEKKHDDAYEIVKRLSHYFPANPKRLSEILRLAITTAKYEDVERYYSFFVNMEERDETLVKYVCAALVVCGKHYLKNAAKLRALDLFQKAAATGTGRVGILKEIVQALIDYGLTKDARTFLAKFPPGDQKGQEYQILDFQLTDVESTRSHVIEVGRKLVAGGVADEHVFSIMIKRSVESKLLAAADTLLQDAIKKYPDKKDHFQKIIKEAQGAA